MQILHGHSVVGEIVIGRLSFYERRAVAVEKECAEDTKREICRYRRAKETAIEQVHLLHQYALREVSQENAAIFQAHHMLLEDMDFNGYVLDMINTQQVNAEYAVKQAADTFYKLFSGIEDPYLKQRAADVLDISRRLLENLTFGRAEPFEPDEPAILAADELVPSEVIQLPRDKALALVTQFGSETSHSAIIAKDRSIPSLFGVGKELLREYEGHIVALDSYEGTLYLDPDRATLLRLKEKKEREEEKRKGLFCLIGKPSCTIDGTRLEILSSTTDPLDIEPVRNSDADGLGLLRSEFLYLKRSDLPSEEEQVNVYREMIRRMNGKFTVIRTLDFGAKKMMKSSGGRPENNPALGFRSVRICLAMPQMFRTQLKAILRAARYGPTGILFPMVDSAEQLKTILEQLEQAKRELEREHQPYQPDIKVGIVIETPASVILSEELAQYADFFHIDSNDLIQYTLAVDRQNPAVNAYYNIHHPAVLKMIESVTAAAHRAGIRVTVSGDMASDETLIRAFAKMGVDALNVPAANVLPMRRKVRELDLSAPQ